MKRVMVLINAAPYGTATPAEAYRTVQGLAGMGIETSCVLIGDGVFILKKGQEPREIDMQKLSDAYKALSEFDVKIYVCSDSLKERGLTLEDLEGPFELVGCEEMNALLDKHDCVLTFTSGG